MDDLKTAIYNLPAIMLGVFVLLAAFKHGWQLLEYPIKLLGLETKGMRQRREERELLHNTANTVNDTVNIIKEIQETHANDKQDVLRRNEELQRMFSGFMSEMREIITEHQSSIQRYGENRTRDRAQSFEIQRELKDNQKDLKESIVALSRKQEEVIQKVQNLAEQNRKYELADMRETLLQSYRYYTNTRTNPMLSWTAMEAHAFWEQYGSYESLGGNDYMHSTVKPEMNKLIEIPMGDIKRVAELMESRHAK